MLNANTNNKEELIFEQDATRKQLAERPPCTDEQDDERESSAIDTIRNTDMTNSSKVLTECDINNYQHSTNKKLSFIKSSSLVHFKQLHSTDSADCSSTSKSRINNMLKRSNNKSKGSIMNTGNNNNHSSTSSSCNDPFRFQGEGVSFKGKLIGVRDVDSARGDVMCSEAMRLAKASIKASGQHKQRIVLNISIEGLKIKDEKTLTTLHNFPVSRISFIARDTTDARAFGFVYGSADNTYKFYGIKTAQTADHAVLSIRDMFQIVFEMKKAHLAEVKQKQEEQQQNKGGDASTTEGDKNGDQVGNKVDNNVAVADLLDLESELFNLEQGVEQLQSIPTFCEDYQTNGCNNYANSDDQWPVPCNNQQQLNAFASDNINDQMNVQNSFNERLALSSNNTANQLNGIHMINPFSDNYYSYNTSNNVTSTPGNFQQQQQQQSNNNNGTNNQLMESQFNDFHKPRQQFATVHSAPNFETNAFSETNPFLNSTNQKFELPSQTQPDPFDTQKAQSIIEFINNKSKQQHQFNNTFNSNSTSFADFDNENKMTRSPCKSKPDTNHPKVTTLEEAFTKLVDMDSLMKQSSHSSDIVNSKSNVTNTNPFSVILSPPKVPLSAMPSSYNPSPLINTSTVASSHQAIPYSASAPFVSSLQSNTAVTNNDPFNDAFFR